MNIVFSYGTLIDKFKKETKRGLLYSSYRLGFYGVYPALIKDTVFDTTKGYIIELDDKEFAQADYYEGYPDLYNRIQHNIVLDDDVVVRAWVYVLNEKHET